MHNAGYRALGLNWRYVPFEVSDLAGALAGMRALNIRGLGVSMPFKREIMPLLDEISDTAQEIGAVNTVVNQDGHLVGHNTDWMGAPRALEERMQLADTKVLLLGAGGAARAVAFGLLRHGARVTLCNRHDEKAQQLANELGTAHMPWQLRDQSAAFDALVNATSLGMSDVCGDSPWSATALRSDLVVMDIVYKPLETQLIRIATKVGATAIHGGRMLLHQAAAQFELYTKQDAPLTAMDAGLRDALAG